ncbi:hypothetical protein B9T31_14970 [Acinetobacter sp. ANC 4558]|uniref:hypothetical protein n=1 Tax=Acinetobacter sp. ANC 4558 TaxID=1977876 RepID=UPI000A33FE3A|nr:hypothetical protein [Acinetobacter sp. ANC 4558]OTG81823.1 hypothetical protein B9T31_14970 [Acinetobacter sp. ANC 4558]
MGDLDKTLQAIASLCPENIPELERLPTVELQVGDQCLLVWSEQKETWRVKSFCADGDVDIVCEKFNAHMAVPKSDLRLVVDFQQSKIEQLEKEKQALHNAFVYMDECRKEWHQGFMRLHEQKNKALKIIEDHARYIPQSTIDALEKALRGES